MIGILFILFLVFFAAIKVINYGRWAGKQGNRRGAVGSYLVALLTVAIPVGVYILNTLR